MSDRKHRAMEKALELAASLRKARDECIAPDPWADHYDQCLRKFWQAVKGLGANDLACEIVDATESLGVPDEPLTGTLSEQVYALCEMCERFAKESDDA